MSILEANISLFIITLLGSVQYVFLAGVPESVSHFAFLCVTNLAGFIISFVFFFGELFRLDARQVLQSIILSAELVVFNLFMLLGASGTDTTITAAVLSSYFVFVVIFSALFMKHAPTLGTIAGIFTVLAGLFLMTDANIHGLMNANIFYLVVADAAFALYIMTTGAYAASSNPSILAMGQMFFCFVFSLALWAAEVMFFGASFTLPSDSAFWGAVIYVSFFIRGLYGIVQIYAQRYVTPLNTSLIFSTEIIITMAISPLMTQFFGTPPESITTLKIAGGVVAVLGLLMTEPAIFGAIKKFFSAGLNVKIILASAVAYAVIDYPVQTTGLLSVHSGLKNFMPFTMGLFFGTHGVIGCCIGCVMSFAVLGLNYSAMLHECAYISVCGLGIWAGWHFFSHSHKIFFRTPKHYARYIILVAVLSAMCFDVKISCSYFICGILIALPLNILFGSVLGVEPVLPAGTSINDDADFVIDADPESLTRANDVLEEAGHTAGEKTKQIFELQSCIEELTIRILKAQPEAKIHVRVRFGYAVSVKMDSEGKKYNPFTITKDEDILDIMSLKIIKHRALRASYSYRNGKNFVHVIV